MPQYLAPDVYVEEIDSGSKPIEGVSTSIVGVAGVTERGPLDVPILVTSYGEYMRWFGGVLPGEVFAGHRYLPHAIEGFFVNGGKLAYVTRVIDSGLAAPSAAELFDRTAPASAADTLLLRTAAESTGTAGNPPPLVVLSDSKLLLNDWIRIGDGSNAEYRQVALAPTPEDVIVPLHLPLAHSHNIGANNAQQFTRAAAGAAVALAAAVAAGAQSVLVEGLNADINAIIAGELVEIGGIVRGEYRFVTAVADIAPVSATQLRARLALDAPLALAYAAAAAVQRLTVPGAAAPQANVTPAARAGDSLLYVAARGGDFDARADLVLLDRSLAVQEVRRIGELSLLSLASAAPVPYPNGASAQIVKLGDDARIALTGAVAAGPNPLPVNDIRPFRAGQQLLVGTAGGPYETVVVKTIVPAAAPAGSLTLVASLAVAKLLGDVVLLRRTLTAAAVAGSNFLALSDRSGLAVGDVVRLADGATEEFVEIVALPLPAPAGASPDRGNVVVRAPLGSSYAVATTQVVRQNTPSVDVALQPSALALGAAAQATRLFVSDANGWTAAPGGRVVEVTVAGGGRYYHRIANTNAPVIAPNPAAGGEALFVTLANPPLERSHAVGAPVVERRPLFLLQALDVGGWGDRLRVSVEDEDSGLVASTRFLSVTNATRARFASVAGVETGSVLEFAQADGTVLGASVKVASVNRANGEVTFDAANALSPAQMGAALTLTVRSREFRLSIYLYGLPDPSAPQRSETQPPAEVFRHLSMDPRHSRYFQRVIGDIGGKKRLSDHRPEGDSWFVRVHDPAQDLAEPARTTALESLRLGPETLVDVLPDGRRRAARHTLAGGDDALGTLTDAHYVGADAADPEQRTGLFALRNVEEISIVACPGRTSAQVQGALIEQCEALRYRFAVLDGPAPPGDSLSDVQLQRQQFDTKYAAMYHPWILIPNPFPNAPGASPDYPTPPSGHMLGIYARIDVERGVHKAPANEVVRGATGLQRILNKEQHDILNPYPVNINVIRDFRNASRGIRVYGGRVITSDSDWKYVNVRRLVIFIEASLNQGLQWVVFEPNAEPLWARVKRSISNFLTLAWRNGALEGTKPEEAFFVKCDRTTMTQTDIDSGRLICVVGVAPVKPAEFVIVRIGLWTAHADD